MVVQGPFNHDKTSELHPAVTIQGFPIVQVCSCLPTRPLQGQRRIRRSLFVEPGKGRQHQGAGVKHQLTG